VRDLWLREPFGETERDMPTADASLGTDQR